MNLVIFSSLVALLLTMPIPTAQAIFGLGQCEKVKKKIQTLELSITSTRESIRGWDYSPNGNQAVTGRIFILDDKSVKAVRIIQKNNPISEIWKAGFNNPKCFTNTQKLRIKELKSDSISNYLFSSQEKKYKQTPFCIKDTDWSKPISETLKKYEKMCFIEFVTALKTYRLYTSLYDY